RSARAAPAAAAGDRARGRRTPLAPALGGALRRRRQRRDRGAAARARAVRGMRSPWIRLAATLAVTAAAAAYILSKIDVGKTIDVIRSADRGWLALSVVLTVGTVPPQAWRWKMLLRVRGIDEPVAW